MNARDVYLIGEDKGLERLMYEWWAEELIPSGTTHVLTLALLPPGICRNIFRWNHDTMTDRGRIVRDLISRIDNALYGSRHENVPANRKFEFFLRTETTTRWGSPTTAHLHGSLAIPPDNRL